MPTNDDELKPEDEQENTEATETTATVSETDETTPSEPQEPATEPEDEQETTEETKTGSPASEDWEAKYQRMRGHARTWEKRTMEANALIDLLKADKASLEQKLAQLEAATARQALMETIATETGVNPQILSRMIGDSEEEIRANAALLAENQPQAKYPVVPEPGNGGSTPPALTDFNTITNPVDRVIARANAIAAARQT